MEGERGEGRGEREGRGEGEGGERGEGRSCDQLISILIVIVNMCLAAN